MKREQRSKFSVRPSVYLKKKKYKLLPEVKSAKIPMDPQIPFADTPRQETTAWV